MSLQAVDKTAPLKLTAVIDTSELLPAFGCESLAVALFLFFVEQTPLFYFVVCYCLQVGDYSDEFVQMVLKFRVELLSRVRFRVEVEQGGEDLGNVVDLVLYVLLDFEDGWQIYTDFFEGCVWFVVVGG